MNQIGETSRIAVAIRSCRGDGLLNFSIEFEEEAAASVRINDVKELLCKPPHSLCREASSLVLVLNRLVLEDGAALVDVPLSRGAVITAVVLISTSGHSRARVGTSQEHSYSKTHAGRQTHAGDFWVLTNPRLQAAYDFWQTVEQFYHSHVRGDGCMDYSLMPCGVTEIHVKYFAFTEHTIFANRQSLMPEALKGLALGSDSDQHFCLDMMNSLSAVGLLLLELQSRGVCEDFEHSEVLRQFRRNRLSIFGLKNATWLNGAEGIVHDFSSMYVSETKGRVPMWLYWPPDAVKRNGGKKALLNFIENTGFLLDDLKHMFEHSPQEFTGRLSEEIDRFKRCDSLVRVFLSVVDFSRVPNLRTPETLFHLRRELLSASGDYRERTLHGWCSRFTYQYLEKCSKNVSLNTCWGCFLDRFPDMQLEVVRAITSLSDDEAGAHVQALMQAEDLVSSSDDHFLHKIGLDLDVIAASVSDFVAEPSNSKSDDFHALFTKYASDSERENFSKIQEVWAKIKGFFSSLIERKDSFESWLKPRINNLLELFLFLIFRDKKGALCTISTRDFFLGMNEQSGGIFLLHLFSVFSLKCFQDIGNPDLSRFFNGFTTTPTFRTSLFPNHINVLTRLPVAIAVLLHRDVCAHLSSCNCLKDGIWFPCNWPPHIKKHLLSFTIFQNLHKNANLRRLLGNHSLFFELKPQVLVQSIDSIALIKFAYKLWSDDLTSSRPDRVVDRCCLQALEEDLRRERLGRALLVADSNAAELIASFFEEDELEDICRYIHIRNQCLERVPVRITGLQKDVHLNGAEGVSDLKITSNGRSRVYLQSPLHVVASCPNGVASVDTSKLEFLGRDVSQVAFFASIKRSINVDGLKILKLITEKLPKFMIAAVYAHPDAQKDTPLRAFLSEVGPLAQNPFETKQFEDLVHQVVDFLLGLVNNLPFSSTIKHLMFEVLGSIGFWARLSNPLTRPEALDYFRIQVRVLTSFDIPPVFFDTINGFFDYMDAKRSQKAPDEDDQPSSASDLFGGYIKSTQNVSEAFQPFINLDPNVTADFFTSLQSIILGDTGIGATFSMWNQMRPGYEQLKQSGMPDMLARVASFDQALERDPAIPSRLQNAGVNARDPLGILTHLPNEVDGNLLVSNIPDNIELVTDQRIVIKSDFIPAFLAGAEGTILKLHDSASEVYEVLIKKPASAVFNCRGERVRKIEKKHLQLSGKYLPKFDFAKNWIDEQDCLQLKNVDYWLTCPKSHPLRCAVPAMIDPRINFCSTCGCDLGNEARSFCECGCAYSVCVECHLRLQHPAPHILPPSDDDAYVHGIKISALRKFKEKWQHTYKNMTTEQFCQMVMKPLTSIQKMSYVNILRQEAITLKDVGAATWFVSHAWKAAFADTVDSILDFFGNQSPQDGDAVVWFDNFFDCQHATAGPSQPSEWYCSSSSRRRSTFTLFRYMNTFRKAIARMGNLLLSVDDWRDPKPLERAWCVLELHAISQKISEGAGRFEITMPSSSRDSFLQATRSCYDMYFMLLSNVDTEYSVCSREKDRESIHKAIKDSIGFHGLNRSIYDVISQWIIDQMKSHINDLKGVGLDPLNVVPRMNDLGTILNQMGRHEEALRTLKNASEMYLQVGSVAPTNFGTTAGSVDAQIDRQIVRIYVHLGQYHLAQSHYDALCARGMSRNDHVFSLKHGGRKVKEVFADNDRDLWRRFRETVTAKFGEAIEKKEIDGTKVDEETVNWLASMLQNVTRQRSDDPLHNVHNNIFETQFYMAYYSFLVLEDADDDEFSAHLQKTFGFDGNFEFLMLEERISDPYSTIQWKKMAFDHKSARLPCAHPAVASAMLRLAHAYVDGNQNDLALPLLQQCLPLLRRLPPFHSDIALALLLRAACLAENCDFAAAAADVAEAQSIWENADTPMIPEVIKGTAKLFYDLFLKMASVGGNPDARGASQFLSVIKEIGSDEARLKKVVINRAWDAEHYHTASSHLMTKNMMPSIRKRWTASADPHDALKDWAAKPDLHEFFKSDVKIPTLKESCEQHQAQKRLQFRASVDAISKEVELLLAEVNRDCRERPHKEEEEEQEEGYEEDKEEGKEQEEEKEEEDEEEEEEEEDEEEEEEEEEEEV